MTGSFPDESPMAGRRVPPTPLELPLDDLWPSRSGSFMNVAAAFCKAQGAMQHAVKDSENPHFKSLYADLASVIDAFRPAFTENGLSVIQPSLPSKPGTVAAQTIILHESGEWIADRGMELPGGSKPQEHGSARTYLRRYALASLVGIAQDDDDANAASTPAPKQTTRKATEPKVKLATQAAREALHERIQQLPEELSKQIGENLRKTKVVWTKLSETELKVCTGWVEECEALAKAATEGPEGEA